MNLFILCLKIFLVRIIDVSLGTVRTVLTVKGKTLLATLTSFFEVFIWFLIVREALNTDETSIFVAISYAGGFATGTYLGMFISNKFIKGNLSLQIIISKDDQIVNKIRKEGYAVSIIDVKGKEHDKDKYMLFIEIDKKRLNHLNDLVKSLDENAFVVVNETKYVQNGFIK